MARASSNNTQRIVTALCADVSHLRALLVTGLTLGAAFLLAGASAPEMRRHAVRGAVFVDGRPAADAVVVFHGPARLQATVTADGTFALPDGAPAGVYAVTVQGRAGLPDNYADPRTSGMRAEVRQGDNRLPAFELAAPTVSTRVAPR
ncbi:MAG: hypothetical protein K2R98_22250 [Gemmataceae bacterium]|nr:hypothetical protein [Gemmataceae bacterium]